MRKLVALPSTQYSSRLTSAATPTKPLTSSTKFVSPSNQGQAAGSSLASFRETAAGHQVYMSWGDLRQSQEMRRSRWDETTSTLNREIANGWIRGKTTKSQDIHVRNLSTTGFLRIESYWKFILCKVLRYYHLDKVPTMRGPIFTSNNLCWKLMWLWSGESLNY